MASRQRLAAVKTIKSKKVKASKAAQILADVKQFGDEPVFTGSRKLVGLDLIKTLNWYNYMCTRTDARDYIETYLRNTGRTAELKLHRRLSDVWVNPQAGWLARILSRGGIVDVDRFNLLLTESLKKVSTNEESAEESPKPVVIRSDDRSASIMAELDKAIDVMGFDFDVYEWLTKKGATTAAAKRARDFFKAIAEEAVEVTKRGADPQLVEGYRSYSKAHLKRRAEFYTKLISDCDQFIDSNTKRRAVRTKKTKVIPLDKKLKNFKVQKESKEYRLVSIDPTKVVGASELWAFNTKYRTLTVFKSIEGKTLDVKGASVVDYDETSSNTYRIGRKTEEQLQKVLSSTRRSISKVLTGLKTTSIQHRSSENTVLLRVF